MLDERSNFCGYRVTAVLKGISLSIIGFKKKVFNIIVREYKYIFFKSIIKNEVKSQYELKSILQRAPCRS